MVSFFVVEGTLAFLLQMLTSYRIALLHLVLYESFDGFVVGKTETRV